jgi:hypothetical protein
MEKVSTSAAQFFLIIMPAGLLASWYLISHYRGSKMLEDNHF